MWQVSKLINSKLEHFSDKKQLHKTWNIHDLTLSKNSLRLDPGDNYSQNKEQNLSKENVFRWSQQWRLIIHALC